MITSDAHRRYLVLEQGLGSIVINIVLNAGIAWLLFRGLDVVPLWGEQSIAGDTIATTLILPFLTCLIVTRLAHREVRNGRFDAPAWRRSEHPILGRLPAKTLARAAVIAVVSLVAFAPPTITALSWLGIAELPFRTFLIFKAVYAGILAGLVAPPIALSALGDAT